MPRLILVVICLVPLAYVLAGAIGLACVTLSSVARTGRAPRVLRDAGTFGAAFRIGIDSTVTWPWTWRKWTDG